MKTIILILWFFCVSCEDEEIVVDRPEEKAPKKVIERYIEKPMLYENTRADTSRNSGLHSERGGTS